jgi:hypothetical protein
MLGIGDNSIAAASAMPVRFSARRRRVNSDLHAAKARAVAAVAAVPAVRVTSEAAKANHRQGA